MGGGGGGDEKNIQLASIFPFQWWQLQISISIRNLFFCQNKKILMAKNRNFGGDNRTVVSNK